MSNFFQLRKISVVFIALFLLASVLEASEPYDEEYGVGITECFSNVSQIKSSGNWRAVIMLNLDNGLWAAYAKEWKSKSQAQQMAAELTFSGNLNILPSNLKDNQFTLVFEDGSNSILVDLWVDVYKSGIEELINSLPFIQRIEEVVQIVSKNKKKYRYILELNPEARWITKETTTPWKKPWSIGSRIIKVGNSKHPCFISAYGVLFNEYRHVESRNVLTDLEQTH